MLPSTLITNARLLNPDGEWDGSQLGELWLHGERIAALAPQAVGVNRALLPPHTRVLDAQGHYALPGGIDPHTHLEMPFMGTTSSDTFESGSRAALFGGTTTILDFAMQSHQQPLQEAIDRWQAMAQKSLCDYSFHTAITPLDPLQTPQQMQALIQQGLPSFKVFMAYKHALMLADEALLAILEIAHQAGGFVLVHCEHGDMIAYLQEKAVQAGRLGPEQHALTRPPLVEAEATSRLLDCASLVGGTPYIVHLSCEAALDRVRAAKKRGQRSYVETCIQYLTLDDALYKRSGFEAAQWVFSPPLRAASDVEHLWDALKAGEIDTVATDHCPFCLDQKRRGEADFRLIPNGMPGIEHRLELLYSEGVCQRGLSLQQWVSASSSRAATLFGLSQKGRLAVGLDADVVLFDPQQQHTLSVETHHMACDYSAFEGKAVQGKVQHVFLRGQWVIEGDRCHAQVGQGRLQHRYHKEA